MRQDRALFLSTLGIRIIAVLTMTLDHVGLFMLMKYTEAGTVPYEVASVFRVVGRLAFPLFALLLAEGMAHTRSKERYLLRIGGMALLIAVAQTIIVYGVGKDFLIGAGNPFIDLLLCALSLYCLTLRKAKKLFAILPIGVIVTCFVVGCVETAQEVTAAWWPIMFRPNLSLLALGATLSFYYGPILAVRFSHKFNQESGISDEIYLETSTGRRAASIVSALLYFVIVMALWGFSYLNNRAYDPLAMSMQSWGLLALIPLFFYNGRKGMSSLAFRIISYAYYPVHLIILYLIFGL